MNCLPNSCPMPLYGLPLEGTRLEVSLVCLRFAGGFANGSVLLPSFPLKRATASCSQAPSGQAAALPLGLTPRPAEFIGGSPVSVARFGFTGYGQSCTYPFALSSPFCDAGSCRFCFGKWLAVQHRRSLMGAVIFFRCRLETMEAFTDATSLGKGDVPDVGRPETREGTPHSGRSQFALNS